MKWNPILQNYQYYLKIEKGLSINTIDSYSRDIKKLIKYLEENEITISPIAIKQDEIQEFIYTTSKLINARSQARLISGLRNFFNYLVFEEYSKENPIDLSKSSFYNPWETIDEGTLAQPGVYTVEMQLYNNGTVTNLVAPVSFMIKALENTVLPAKDRAEKVAFQKQVAQLEADYGNTPKKADVF